MSLVRDEGQVVNKREDRNVLYRQKTDIAAKGDKSAAHIVLVNILIRDPANGSEALTLCRFIVLSCIRFKGAALP